MENKNSEKTTYPILELNKENVLRMIKNTSKGDLETIVPASALVLVFGKEPKDIEKVMDELVKDGKLIKANFFGLKGYKLKK